MASDSNLPGSPRERRKAYGSVGRISSEIETSVIELRFINATANKRPGRRCIVAICALLKCRTVCRVTAVEMPPATVLDALSCQLPRLHAASFTHEARPDCLRLARMPQSRCIQISQGSREAGNTTSRPSLHLRRRSSSTPAHTGNGCRRCNSVASGCSFSKVSTRSRFL
jgi:hypothetical protein